MKKTTCLFAVTVLMEASAAFAGWTMPVGGTISTVPMILKSSVPPNVIFALSVEYPTANTAAYQGSNDYSTSNEYLGYFDSFKCYEYDAGKNWFAPAALATDRVCAAGMWSGNFLNWATMTGLDEFRYAMTGGNRYVDAAGLTVLERSYQSGQGGTSNFTDKTFSGSGATAYPANTSLTIQNQGQGVKMKVSTASFSNTVTCSGPQISGNNSFTCGTLTLDNYSGNDGSCTNWTGDGTSGSPYKCAAFGNFSNGETVSSITSTTTTHVSSAAASDTVNCTDPAFASPFACTMTLASSSTPGTCVAWTGSGAADDPYKCSTFSSFGSTTLSSSTPGVATSADLSNAGAISCANPTVDRAGVFSCTPTLGTRSGSCSAVSGAGTTSSPYRCTAFGAFTGVNVSTPTPATSGTFNAVVDTKDSCSVTSGTIKCTLPNNDTATCRTKRLVNTKSRNGASNPYYCTDFDNGTGGEVLSIQGHSATTYVSGTYYDLKYSLSYSAPYYATYSTTISGTVYYYPTYAVNGAIDYYYTSSYGVTYSYPSTYYVRVKACDPGLGVDKLASNCKAYGSNYKPEGAIQTNGDAMRFGVFSYFNADSTDNAVMRSKAKYVAPTKYSQASGSVTNAAMEWSPTDGTFMGNPDGDVATASYPSAVTRSGVINYINQFGSFSSTYKTYDVVGKLYYESLKYLRGLQPTSSFYTSATASSADGFPIITTWDDPYKDSPDQDAAYSCRKSYIMLMGDTHTWCDKKLPGGTYTSGQDDWRCSPADYGSLSGDNGVNVSTLTSAVGTLEGRANLATTVTGAGGASYYMAGLAYWANKATVRSDVAQPIKTMILDVEEYKDCGKGSQFWLAAKYGGANSFDGTTGAAVNWASDLTLAAGACNSGAPSWYSSSASSHGDWPKNLLRAADPAGMVASVNAALQQVAAENGQVAALAQSSGSLISGGAYFYRAGFTSKEWIGDLSAWAINSAGGIATVPTWNASDHIPDPAARVIYTFNDGRQLDGAAETSTNAHKGIVFKSTGTADLSSRERAFLNRNPGGATDGYAARRIAYLTGDRTDESTTDTNSLKWRQRTSVLGDIVDSNPTYVGVPPAPFLPGSGYNAFAKSIKGRTPVVYVGGNDGMLHGFDASPPSTPGHTPGKELMAFVPSSVYGRLNQLMSPTYNHLFYVDGSPVAGEVCLGSCGGQSSWRTILAGGLKSGGRGMYALDVTDPANFTTSKAADVVLWELTSLDDKDIGYTYSKPDIRFMQNGKWAVIFGNGLNNTTSSGTGDPISSTGRAYLYVVFVDGPGSGNAWGTPCAILASGTDCGSGYKYVKIELPSPQEYNQVPLPALPLNPPNGLTTVASVDVNGDGKIDYIYAGDLQGNVWKIDVSDANPANWKPAMGTVEQPTPLFTATDSLGNAQPITSGFQVSRHPNGGYLVMFGTGSYIYSGDSTSTGKQSAYGIWDQAGTQATAQTFPVPRSKLQIQKQLLTVTPDSTEYVVLSNCTPYYGTQSSDAVTTAVDGTSQSDPNCPNIVKNPGQQMGWVLELPNSMERIIMDHPLLSSGVLTFTSMAPKSVNPCDGGSTGWRYDLDYLTGGRLPYSVYANAVGSTSPVAFTYTLGGVTVTGYASGQKLSSGASETPASFSMNPGSVTPPGTSGGTAVSLGSTFLPGWGLPALSGSVCMPKIDVMGGDVSKGVAQCVRGSQGRVSWRALQ